MRTFHYSAIKEQKWDSDIPGFIAAITDMRASRNSSIEGSLRKLVKEEYL